MKLQRAIDASSILANKGSLSAPISIQPDKSPVELQIESILMKERWNLIQAGHQHKTIRESIVEPVGFISIIMSLRNLNFCTPLNTVLHYHLQIVNPY